MTATITQTLTTSVEVRPSRATDRRGRRNHTLCPTTGKRRFRDRHDAGLELRRLGHQRSSLDAQDLAHGIRVLRVYRCQHCRGWHLTSQPLKARGPQRKPRTFPVSIVPTRLQSITTTTDAGCHRAPAAA